MVTHYEAGRIRSNGDRPAAVTCVLLASSGSSSGSGELPLGTPPSRLTHARNRPTRTRSIA